MSTPNVAIQITSDATAAATGINATADALNRVDTAARDASTATDNAARSVKSYGDAADRAAASSGNVSAGVEGVGDTAGTAATGLGDLAGVIELMGFEGLAASMTITQTVMDGLSGASDLYKAASQALSGTVGKLTGKTAANTVATKAGTTATNASRAANIRAKTVTIAQTAATKVMTITQKALNLAMKMNPIGLVVIAITALVALFVTAYNKCETFRKIVDKLWKILKNSLVAAFDAVSDAVSTVVGWFQSAWDWVKKLINKIGDLKLPDWVPGVGGNIMVGATVVPAGAGRTGGSPAPAATGGVVVNFNGPVGDPHAVARELRRVLRDDQSRLGRHDRPA